MEATLWPYGKCEKCANKNYCAWSESEILNCMNNDYPNFSPMRNADRISAMTDEELAEFISGVEAEAIRRAGLFITVGDIQRGKEGWLDWLKQEAVHGSTD